MHVAECMRLFRALGDQVGVWVQFGVKRLRLVQLEEVGDEKEVVVGQDVIEEVGGLQYVRRRLHCIGRSVTVHCIDSSSKHAT